VDVELRQLESLVAVAEELSFTAASRRLHVTQQSVSAMVRRLEINLGVSLFERSTRQVVPTPECEALVPAVRSALVMLEAALARAKVAHSGERPLRLAFTPATTFGPLQELLDAFAEVGLENADVREMWADELPDALLTGRFDAAIGVELRSGPEITLVPWQRQRVDLLVAADHPLSTRAAVTVSELGAVTLALPDRSTNAGFHERLAAVWDETGVHPKISEAPRVAGPAPPGVESGEAVTVWLSSMDDRYVPNGLVHVALVDPEIIVTTYLATAVGGSAIPTSSRLLHNAIQRTRSL
jgi:DNA-binding transcriptional LysR family regulator